jgi:nitrite reductase (NO-forming)/hydroxylamine reductase
VLRKGATGKNLEPHWSKKAKDGKRSPKAARSSWAPRLEKIIALGTEGGMVNYDDILTKEEINIMARYIQRTCRMCRRSSASRTWRRAGSCWCRSTSGRRSR